MENINYIDGGEYLSKPNNNNNQQEFRRVRTPKKGKFQEPWNKSWVMVN